MSRLLVRRCSMSSIEEEDEPTTSEDLTIHAGKYFSSTLIEPYSFDNVPSVVDWDSELSESEQEFDDNDEDPNEDGEDRAANRALQNLMKTYSRTKQIRSKDKSESSSPSSLLLYDDDGDSGELDAIISELRDFKIQFEECGHSQNPIIDRVSPSIKMNKTETTTTSTTHGCVNELRTLEDQLEAALASLTLTINDCTTNSIDIQQQRSSGSSACSSGLGDEIGNETSNLYHLPSPFQNNSFSSKFNTLKSSSILDDCDSAYSESGSSEKITSTVHQDESINSSLAQKQENSSIINNQNLIQTSSKLLVRTYNDDGSTKSILIDETMSIRDVIFILVHKNHREPDVDYALVEILPDLHMERTFEDHQKLTESILTWPISSSNRLLFTKRIEKNSIFRSNNFLTDKDETIVAYEELLKTPDIEGIIYLKEKSRKSWKKHFCVLRSSGIYFVPKGKSKKDLVCLAKLENVELFFGIGWKKKFKSPSEFCFALKHPLIQKKSSKYIKYMCVETKIDFDRWTNSIRIGKFGQQLKINFLLMEKAMNIYRRSGRFASICSSRSSPNDEKKIERSNFDSTSNIPTPCSTIRDRQVLNRATTSSQMSFSSPNSTRSTRSIETTEKVENLTIDDEEEQNDENSPIKSASYMDELRQRLERVLNDSNSTSNLPSLTNVQKSNSSLDRLNSGSILKTVRPQNPIQSSGIGRPPILSRVPTKSIPSTSKNLPTSRTNSLITPPKLKSTIPTPNVCLSSTENLRNHHEHEIHQNLLPLTVGSTPLPRKQIHINERNSSYRTSNAHSFSQTNTLPNPNHVQNMSKSFILTTKREDHRSVSTLSMASKADTVSLDETDGSMTTSQTNKMTQSILKTKPTRSKLPSTVSTTTNKKPTIPSKTASRVQPPLPLKQNTASAATQFKLTNSISQTALLNKSLTASTSNNSLINKPTPMANNKLVPPVPPRKSSIPRPSANGTIGLAFKPQPPQRDSSNHFLLGKSHISHL